MAGQRLWPPGAGARSRGRRQRRAESATMRSYSAIPLPCPRWLQVPVRGAAARPWPSRPSPVRPRYCLTIPRTGRWRPRAGFPGAMAAASVLAFRPVRDRVWLPRRLTAARRRPRPVRSTAAGCSPLAARWLAPGAVHYAGFKVAARRAWLRAPFGMRVETDRLRGSVMPPRFPVRRPAVPGPAAPRRPVAPSMRPAQGTGLRWRVSHGCGVLQCPFAEFPVPLIEPPGQLAGERASRSSPRVSAAPRTALRCELRRAGGHAARSISTGRRPANPRDPLDDLAQSCPASWPPAACAAAPAGSAPVRIASPRARSGAP